MEFQHMAFLASPGPRSYTEAVTGLDSAQWSAAIASEMKSLRELDIVDNTSSKHLWASTQIVDSMSNIWVKSQPRPDEAAALSCIWNSSGGRGGNSPLVTRQVTTGDIQTTGGKLPPRVTGRVGDG